LEIAGALVLVGAIVGWYFIGVDTTTTGAPNGTVTVTQSADASLSATDERTLSGNPHAYKLGVVDLRVGDCFDLKDPRLSACRLGFPIRSSDQARPHRLATRPDRQRRHSSHIFRVSCPR
jgi:hypothetical protein